MSIFDALATLPYFNPDLDGDSPPSSVVELRTRFGAAEALLIAMAFDFGSDCGIYNVTTLEGVRRRERPPHPGWPPDQQPTL